MVSFHICIISVVFNGLQLGLTVTIVVDETDPSNAPKLNENLLTNLEDV